MASFEDKLKASLGIVSPESNYAAGSMALTASQLAPLGLLPMIGAMRDREINPSILRQMIDRSGVNVAAVDVDGPTHNYFYVPPDAKGEFSEKILFKDRPHGTIGKMHGSIPIGPKLNEHTWGGSFAAHELGHAKARFGEPLEKAISHARTLPAMGIVGAASPITALLALFDRNQESRDKKFNIASGIGALHQAPVLADEYNASRNAMKLLRKIKLEDTANGVIDATKSIPVTKILSRAKVNLPLAYLTYLAGAGALVGGPQIAKHIMHRPTSFSEKLHLSKQASALDHWGVQTVGGFIPGVSSVLSGRNAYNAFKGGRIAAGLGHTALAGLGLIPGAGFAGGLLKGVGRYLGSASRLGNMAHGIGSTIGHAANAAGRAMPGAKTVLGANVNGATSIGRGFRANNRLALAGIPVGIGEDMQIARQQTFDRSVDSGLDVLRNLHNMATRGYTGMNNLAQSFVA